MKWLLLILCNLSNACSNLPSQIKNPPLFDISYAQAIQKINDFINTPCVGAVSLSMSKTIKISA